MPTEPIRNDVRLLRFLAQDMTQAELGQRVGLTRQTIAAIEQGRYSPSLDVAFRIADVFGKRIDEVFHWRRDGEAATDAKALASVLEHHRGLPEEPRQPPLTWITASVGKETRLILVDDVAYFRSDDKYPAVVTAEGEALIRKPIRDLLPLLDPNTFKQVHRSTIVNLRAVAGISRDDSGRGTMRIRNRPETLAVSLTFMPLFRNM